MTLIITMQDFSFNRSDKIITTIIPEKMCHRRGAAGATTRQGGIPTCQESATSHQANITTRPAGITSGPEGITIEKSQLRISYHFSALMQQQEYQA
jgi:hypothetical protein